MHRHIRRHLGRNAHAYADMARVVTAAIENKRCYRLGILEVLFNYNASIFAGLDRERLCADSRAGI